MWQILPGKQEAEKSLSYLLNLPPLFEKFSYYEEFYSVALSFQLKISITVMNHLG